MSRLLLLIAIAAVIYLLIKSFRKRIDNENITTKTEDMVRCAHCGTHIPKGECIEADGNNYCSEAHRRAHTDQTR